MFNKLVLENWKMKLVSLFIAIGVWTYVQELKMGTINISVPVKYINKPDSLYWKSEPPRFIKVVIRGREDELKFPTNNLKATVNLEKAIRGTNSYHINFDLAQIPDRINILSMPKNMSIELEMKITKSFWIRANIIGEVAEGFNKGRVTITPQKIRMEGPESAINSIQFIETDSINIDKAEDGIKKKASLVSPISSLKFLDSAIVDVNILVYQENKTNEKFIDNIRVEIVNLDPALKAILSDTNVKIHIQGDQKILKTISNETFQATINLEGTRFNPITKNILPFDTEAGIPIQIKNRLKNSNVQILEVAPDSLTVRFIVKPEFLKSIDEKNANSDEIIQEIPAEKKGFTGSTENISPPENSNEESDYVN
jgi:YbbR domain-containing protein